MQNNDTSPTYGDTNPPDPPPLNKSPGNQSKDVHWVQQHLASSREDNWICTKGAGPRSFINNPTKAVYTLFNWHNKDITASDLKAIEYINSLKEPMLLAESIKSACHDRGITLTRGKKTFADLFSCQEPDDNLILIIAVAKVHAHEKGQMGTPKDENFTVLLLLHQKEPQVCLPFADSNIHPSLGAMIKTKEYKASASFDTYMKRRVNHKLVPVQHAPAGAKNLEQVMHFAAYYITEDSANSTA